MNKKTKELNRLNNELNKQIYAENKEAFTDMICYLRGANISEYDQELVRQDLTEMILSAQKRGEGIRAVIGEDYKAFCDDIVASLPAKSKKERVLEFIDIICWGLSTLGVINIVIAEGTIALLRDLVGGRPTSFDISISIGSVISCGIIIVAAYVIVEVLLKNAFQVGKKKGGRSVKAFLVGAGMMAGFLLIAWFGKETLFTVNIFIACAFVLIMYLVHRMIERL